MPSRPGWTAILLGLCACGELPDPPWLLSEVPRVLAIRFEVVEPGPQSDDLLPIPADRIRSQPLPGDTIDVSTWVVAGEQEVPTRAVDPAWFLCPRAPGCVSTLSRPEAREPCAGVVPQDVACRLPDGDRPRVVVPALDPSTPLEDQSWFRIAMVGHIDEQMTTADCIQLVSDVSAEDWTGCLVAYRGTTLGPARRLVMHAMEVGSELSETLETALDLPTSPPFNPEVISLELFPYYGNRRFDRTRGITVAPSETAVLEPGVVYGVQGGWDRKDLQQIEAVSTSEPTGFSSQASTPIPSLFTSTPELLEFSMTDGWQLWAPEEPASFALRYVLRDSAGGTAWATFNFEVSAP